MIHESAPYISFNEGVVLQLHTILYRCLPQVGFNCEVTSNDIIERHPDSTSRLRFNPVTAHLTPMAMADLSQHYARALNKHLAGPLVPRPLAMLDLLVFHAFSKGNGRIFHLLRLLLRYHFDYAMGRCISLERIFENTEIRRCWKLGLRACIGQHDVKPWLDHFWGPCCRPITNEVSVDITQQGRCSRVAG